MDKKLDLIVAKDENNNDIIVNIYVDNDRNITGINFAGITYSEQELNKLELEKIDEELYSQINENEPLDISINKKYANKSTKEIIELFEKKLTN